MGGDLVLVQRDDHHGVATVTLNRPEARNALSSAMMAALDEAMAGVMHEADVGCVVLTGTDPAFCAGLDLRELGSSGRNLEIDFLAHFRSSDTPVVGAVNGPAVTGGLELALACDVLYASERARFADTHARVGVMPGAGMSVLLPQAVGLRRAKEMTLSGNFLGADEALACGLVNRLVPHGELVAAAQALARDISCNDRGVVARLKRQYDEGALLTAGEGLRREAEAFREYNATLDPSRLAARRESVLERNRGQLGR